jgi:hypothetical protein
METNDETTTTETPAKTFTQDELDRIVADRIARENRKFDKRISGIDLEEARTLKAEKEALDVERLKDRGDFDLILKNTVEKHVRDTALLTDKLHTTLIDGAILGAAGNSNAVNPDQVAMLLKRSARLSEDGLVEVLDANGLPRYNDKGDLLSVGEMVSEFLTVNPHFVRASQGGTGSQGNTGGINDGPGKTKSREEFEQLNPAKRMSFVKSGGTIT